MNDENSLESEFLVCAAKVTVFEREQMTTTTFVNQTEIKEVLSLILAKPKSSNKPKAIEISPNEELRNLTVCLNEISSMLPEVWKTLSVERKQVLTDLAYKLVDSDQQKSNFFDSLLLPFTIISTLIQYKPQTLQDFKGACDFFADAIFNEIENSSLHHQELLNDVLNEAINEITARENGEAIGKEIKTEDTREWLRNLSNSAIAKV